MNPVQSILDKLNQGQRISILELYIILSEISDDSEPLRFCVFEGKKEIL